MDKAQINLMYDYNAGEAYFDNISFIRDDAVQYKYNGDGSLYSEKDRWPGFKSVYNYDDLGRLLDKTTRLTSDGSFRRSVSFTYDAYNRLSQAHYGTPLGTYSESFAYNNDDGSLTSFTPSREISTPTPTTG